MKTIAINKKSRTHKKRTNNRFENYTIPNLITYFTLVFSLSGIYLLLNSRLLLGALLLWTVCDIFDTLDGFIAKKFNMFSPLGADLDSLVDVIAFLIPPFLIGLQSGNNFLLISAFFFVFSGIYRLARFNVEKSAPGVVVGLQASLASHLIYLSLLINVPSNYLSIIYIVLSLLMVSPKKSKGKYSLYLTALLITLNILLIVLKLFGLI
ncbi:MAG: hypothetical protein GY866_37815 [Proteobacteria bacterium]|nr:hypothetical protein [Pseudomonadota bacterium]